MLGLGLSLGLGGGGAPPVAFDPDYTTLNGLLNGFAKCAAWDLSDYSTQWQDLAGTTTQVTGVAQTLGHLDDVTTNGNDLVAPTTGERPLTDANFTLHDDSDDIMSFGFSGAAGSTDMTVVMASKISDANGILIGNHDAASASRLFYQSGNANSCFTSMGTPTVEVDGVAPTATRGGLFTALDGGIRRIVLKNADFSGWTGLSFGGGYTQTDFYTAAGNHVPIAVIDNTALTAPNAASALAAAEALADLFIAEMV